MTQGREGVKNGDFWMTSFVNDPLCSKLLLYFILTLFKLAYNSLIYCHPFRSAKRRSPTKKHSSHQSSEFPGSSRQQQFNFGAQNPVSGPLDPYILSYYHTHGNWGSDETREEFLERFGNALLEVFYTFVCLFLPLIYFCSSPLQDQFVSYN